MPRTAYRIETERLVIRCYDPAADAALMKASIDSTLEHLRPWMPWAWGEPTSLDEKVGLLRRFRGRFDLDEDYTFGVFTADEARLVGGTGLHKRSDERALEIGYWVHADDIGNGYATELTAALTKVAFELYEIPRVEIWTATDNARSAAVPRKLGYTREGVLRQRRQVKPSIYGDMVVWTMLLEEYPRSVASDAVVRAFDLAGDAILGSS